MHEQDSLSAFDAITEAQRIAFAPMLFQTALCLRNSGVLSCLSDAGSAGASLEKIVVNCDIDEYAVNLLLDMGLSGKIITCRDNIYRISKIGHYLLHDPMTRVNMDFTQDVCYQGLFYLEQSLKQSKPVGLKVFSDAGTIYPVLSELPPQTQKSWFAFDHYYSDVAFNTVLPYIFSASAKNLYDVGGNTGKWAQRCCQYDDNVKVTILDLPQQITLARQHIENIGFSDRIAFHSVDMLSESPLPGEADIWWMSQFLDCFSPEQIITMLSRIARVMKPGARLAILELFWDTQRFEASSFSLNATSLYFTCMANGNSRFYSDEKFCQYLEMAGFQVTQRVDNIGIGHTLLICEKCYPA